MNCIELRCARIRYRKSTHELAKAIGKSDSAYNMRERGDVGITLDEAGIIGRTLGLTEDEYVTIFHDGIVPYRKTGADCP